MFLNQYQRDKLLIAGNYLFLDGYLFDRSSLELLTERFNGLRYVWMKNDTVQLTNQSFAEIEDARSEITLEAILETMTNSSNLLIESDEARYMAFKQGTNGCDSPWELRMMLALHFKELNNKDSRDPLAKFTLSYLSERTLDGVLFNRKVMEHRMNKSPKRRGTGFLAAAASLMVVSASMTACTITPPISYRELPQQQPVPTYPVTCPPVEIKPIQVDVKIDPVNLKCPAVVVKPAPVHVPEIKNEPCVSSELNSLIKADQDFRSELMAVYETKKPEQEKKASLLKLLLGWTNTVTDYTSRVSKDIGQCRK